MGAVVLTGAGCSGGDDDDDDNANSEAVGKCTTFISVYCTSVVDCLVDSEKIEANERDVNVDACKDAASEGLDCSRAGGVSSSYDACLAAIANPDCAAVNAAIDNKDTSGLVPEVCHGVILLYP